MEHFDIGRGCCIRYVYVMSYVSSLDPLSGIPINHDTHAVKCVLIDGHSLLCSPRMNLCSSFHAIIVEYHRMSLTLQIR